MATFYILLLHFRLKEVTSSLRDSGFSQEHLLLVLLRFEDEDVVVSVHKNYIRH